MNTAISQEQQALHALIAEAEQNLSAMRNKLRAVEAELESVSAQKEQYQLLGNICDSLGRLHELGVDDLFWGKSAAAGNQHLERVRRTVAEFGDRIGVREESRKSIEEGIRAEVWKLEALNHELADLKFDEQRRLDEFVIEREASELPYRPTVMPWSKRGEEERRFRKVLLSTLLVSVLVGYTAHHWTLPLPEKDKPIEIPERLAKLVKQPEPPPPPPKPEQEKKPETKKDPAEKKETKPTPVEKQKARKTAESSGVLAFKNSFSDMIDNAPEAKLGVDARVTNAGQKSKGGQTQRSIVTSAAKSGSGGIDTAALSRDLGGGRGEVTGVTFSRVDSAIGTDMQDDADRPLSDGPGPSRTDEEIQIVFDRYKATLYRIYNKELRKDPTLQGKLTLRITIEPDGRVSQVRAESTDLASEELVAQIVDRVRRFNFGPKEGVPKVTILYPIDFLPAS